MSPLQVKGKIAVGKKTAQGGYQHDGTGQHDNQSLFAAKTGN
jgi:hypothetical protein